MSMFTGIIEEIGTVQQVRSEQSVRTLEIKAQNILVDIRWPTCSIQRKRLRR